MKRFIFPLQRVLEFRRQQEEVERSRLALLAAERVRQERQAEAQGAESRRERAACAAATALPASEVRHAYEGAAALLRAREQSLHRAKQAEEKRLQQLDVVLAARLRVRLLELLREKKRFRHGRLADRELETIAGELHLAKLQRESPKKL
jgi:hypothetical protein